MQLFRSRPFVEFTASRQVNIEIDRKEGGSALEPLPDLEFGKKDVTNFIISERPH